MKNEETKMTLIDMMEAALVDLQKIKDEARGPGKHAVFMAAASAYNWLARAIRAEHIRLETLEPKEPNEM